MERCSSGVVSVVEGIGFAVDGSGFADEDSGFFLRIVTGLDLA